MKIPIPRASVGRSACLVFALGLLSVLEPGGLTAQEEADTLETQQADSIRAVLARLQARIDSLETVVRRLQGEGEQEEAEEAGDALAALRAAAEEAAAEGGQARDTAQAGREPTFSGRQRSLQALNPEISVNADLFGHLNTDDANAQNFVPREFEFSFQSALDPFSRAKIFLSVHNPGPELVPFGEGHGHGGEEGHDEGPSIGVEEGYVEWVGLLGGLNLKVGKFFQRFGALNRWHAHALPFQSRSLPHLTFIGEEPLAQTGASVQWLAPVHGAGTYEATIEVTRSSNGNLFGESSRPSVLGNVNAFWQISEATDLDLNLSWTNGSYEDEAALFDRNLFGAEMALTWLPPARSKYRGVTFRGGAMLLDGLVGHGEHEGEEPEGEEEGELHPGEGEALGLWSMAEVRLGRQWLAGARFDWVENPAEPDETAWLVSPTLTWWQSEYVRLRAEYDLLGRSALDDREGRLWLQITLAMGPHKHETY